MNKNTLQEPLFEYLDRYLNYEIPASVAMEAGQTAMDMSGVYRVPRYDEIRRENNAEHSFMLQLTATEMAAQYFPDLDIGLVAQFSAVHDLPELITGDVPTFHLDETAQFAKSQQDQQATHVLCQKLPSYTAHLLAEYEKQEGLEARFVRFIDKLLPVIVDILGPGPKVMNEDYNVYTVEQLDAAEQAMRERYQKMFPDDEFVGLHAVRSHLSKMFSNVFAKEIAA